MILRLAQNLMAVFLALCLSVLPALSKNVSLDFVNANRQLDAELAPYHKRLRLRLEEEWAEADPRLNRTLTVKFRILEHGLIVIPEVSQYQPGDPRMFAAGELFEIQQIEPLPAGQEPLDVIAEFKSRKLEDNAPGSSGGSNNQHLTRALFALAALGLIGLTGWGLYKLAKSESQSGSGTNPDFEWVNWPHRRASDGVWVQGYWRTKANGTMYDNFSSLGNINPFTGQPGTVVPTH